MKEFVPSWVKYKSTKFVWLVNVLFTSTDVNIASVLFTLVEKILDVFETEIHRVRFMKLKPGGGELERHTDQVDPDVGIQDGKLMRIHIPIKTNPNVEFTSWSTTGSKVIVNMEEGHCWYLDIRKPHIGD